MIDSTHYCANRRVPWAQSGAAQRALCWSRVEPTPAVPSPPPQTWADAGSNVVAAAMFAPGTHRIALMALLLAAGAKAQGSSTDVPKAQDPCAISSVFAHLQKITQLKSCRDGCHGGKCPPGWLPGASDKCSAKCGALVEPFWDQCGSMLTKAKMGGMVGLGKFYNKCLKTMYRSDHRPPQPGCSLDCGYMCMYLCCRSIHVHPALRQFLHRLTAPAHTRMAATGTLQVHAVRSATTTRIPACSARSATLSHSSHYQRRDRVRT